MVLDLSVVVAALDAERTLDASVSALETACAGLRAEILVVGPRAAWLPGVVAAHPKVIFRVVTGTPTVPDLWSAGIVQATGKVVALTTGHLIVDPVWARALTDALALPAGGAGGPIDLMPCTTVVDWAIFYLRYSAFLPSRWADGPVTGDIAGDNAAYWLEDLRRHQGGCHHGFWEVEFHRHLKAAGRPLRAVSGACARLGPSYRFGAFVRQRLAHGRHFGHMRVQDGDRSHAALVAGAPLVPFVLASRTARRVWADRHHRRRFLISLPVFLIFAAAWATGEAWGALAGHGAAA